MPQEQIEPLRNVAKAAKRVGDLHDLALQHFSLSPSLNDTPDRVTLAFDFDPEGKNKPELIITQADDTIKQALDEAYKEEQAKKAEKAREELKDLQERLKKPGGFLE
jgi:hypothetical protein